MSSFHGKLELRWLSPAERRHVANREALRAAIQAGDLHRALGHAASLRNLQPIDNDRLPRGTTFLGVAEALDLATPTLRQRFDSGHPELLRRVLSQVGSVQMSGTEVTVYTPDGQTSLYQSDFPKAFYGAHLQPRGYRLGEWFSVQPDFVAAEPSPQQPWPTHDLGQPTQRLYPPTLHDAAAISLPPLSA